MVPRGARRGHFSLAGAQPKLAMRVDREYHVWQIQRRHWEGSVRLAPLYDLITDVEWEALRARHRSRR